MTQTNKEVEEAIIAEYDQTFARAIMRVGNASPAAEYLSAAVRDFLSQTLTTYRESVLAEVREKVDAKKFTFKKVDWGDGIIVDEPVEDETKSLNYAQGFNAALDAVLFLFTPHDEVGEGK